MGVFNKTIIPLVLVRYEMIILANSYPRRPRGIIVRYKKLLEKSASEILAIKMSQVTS